MDSTSGTTTDRHLRRMIGWSKRTRHSWVSGRDWREVRERELPRGVEVERMPRGEGVVMAAMGAEEGPAAAEEAAAAVGVVIVMGGCESSG